MSDPLPWQYRPIDAGYPLPWQYRSARRPPPPAARHVPAVLPEQLAEFADRPYLGSSYGELFTPAPVPQPTTTVPSLTPPAPDWQEEERERRERGESPGVFEPLPAGGALAELMAQDGGYQPRPFGVPVETQPVQRFAGVEVDWREEERLAAAESRRAALEHARLLLGRAAEPVEEEPASLAATVPSETPPSPSLTEAAADAPMPMIHGSPLRPMWPKPDWAAEERERLARERAADPELALLEEEPARPPYPPARRGAA